MGLAVSLLVSSCPGSALPQALNCSWHCRLPLISLSKPNRRAHTTLAGRPRAPCSLGPQYHRQRLLMGAPTAAKRKPQITPDSHPPPAAWACRRAAPNRPQMTQSCTCLRTQSYSRVKSLMIVHGEPACESGSLTQAGRFRANTCTHCTARQSRRKHTSVTRNAFSAKWHIQP